jgi:hypothetical protein
MGVERPAFANQEVYATGLICSLRHSHFALRSSHFPCVLHSPPIPNWKLTLPAVPLFLLSVSQASAKDQFYEAMGASVSSAFQQAKSFVTMLCNSAREAS